MFSRNCNQKTSPASYSRPCSREARYDQGVRIVDLMRERAGAVIPAFSLFGVRLQIAASRAAISRDLMVRTVLRQHSAPKRLLRFAWLPLRHNARCVIF